ncbi:hypothetical protein NKG05_16170 [Oerskovia sp. M15]
MSTYAASASTASCLLPRASTCAVRGTVGHPWGQTTVVGRRS